MNYGIIFDLDGTLWDSSEQVVPAWNRALERHKGIRSISVNDMKGYMGRTIADIAKIMMPEIPDEKRMEIMKECCQEEQVYIEEHGGKLFPELEETLIELKKKYNLFIVSNCQDGYIEAFLNYHNMHQHIKDIECIGRSGKSKGENIRLIIKRNNLDRAVYVGDTQLDYEATKIAEVPFIHAKYGFGSINEKVPEINSISELPMVVDEIVASIKCD